MATCAISEEVEGVGVTFALVLEAVLVPPAALADALHPRWTLLAEIALLQHQLTVLHARLPGLV
jgi:hypothetical protein